MAYPGLKRGGRDPPRIRPKKAPKRPKKGPKRPKKTRGSKYPQKRPKKAKKGQKRPKKAQK